MSDFVTLLMTLLAAYALVTGIFLISENRRPQSTLAWLLAFYFAPGLGVAAYFLFGRHWRAFSHQRKLLMQELKGSAGPLLAPLMERQDAELARLEQRGLAHKKLVMLVRRSATSVLTTRNQVQLQQDAAVFYPNLMEDMKRARHSIHHQYYIWRSDSFTENFKDIMVEKAKSGVEVRLLYDPIGSLWRFSRQDARDMARAGVDIAPTSPLYDLHTLSFRNHRKLSVIDGRIGYTGGINIGREHLDGGKGFTSWRDTQLRVVGEAAAVLQTVFLTDWYNAVRENLFRAEYFPSDIAATLDGDVPVQMLTSGPDSQWSAIRQLYANMIVSARQHVYLQSPYFILEGSIADALTSAAMAGIDVKVMLSAGSSGNILPAWAGNTYVADVVAAGVQVYLYEKGYLHAKTISIDSSICSIGSANIDIRSFSINYELNAVLYDAAVATELEQDFERDLTHCRPFRLDEYQHRNPLVRFRDSVARLFSPLL